MSVREEVAYPILRKHDVDYVLVIFGGLLGFSGDDLNKFLWMVRISEGIWPEEVNEQKFFTSRGEYKVDGDATETMKNSLMYKMSYYRFVASTFAGVRPRADLSDAQIRRALRRRTCDRSRAPADDPCCQSCPRHSRCVLLRLLTKASSDFGWSLLQRKLSPRRTGSCVPYPRVLENVANVG